MPGLPCDRPADAVLGVGCCPAFLARNVILFIADGGGVASDAHTGEDVPLFSYGPGSERFAGNLDNTDIGRLLAGMLEVSLPHLEAAE